MFLQWPTSRMLFFTAQDATSLIRDYDTLWYAQCKTHTHSTNYCYNVVKRTPQDAILSQEHTWACTDLHHTAPNGVVWCGASLGIILNVCAWGTCIADPICVELSKTSFRVTENTPVRHRSNRNGRKAVHFKRAQNSAHFNGLTMIGSSLHSAWACLEHMPQVVYAVHTGMPRQFGAVRCSANLCMLKCVPSFKKEVHETSFCSWWLRKELFFAIQCRGR